MDNLMDELSMMIRLLDIAAKAQQRAAAPVKCDGPVVIWADEDLHVRRCAHGTTEIQFRNLEAGMVPGRLRRMAGMN
jgi:hypothetical protein